MSRGHTALHYSCENGNEEITTMLLKAGAKEFPDIDGYTQMTITCQNGHAGCLKLLIDTGKFNVDAKDKIGWTPLHWAYFNDSRECIQLLIRAGANENIRDIKGRKPMHAKMTECVVNF